jgi:23S rRNA (uridine2552-2'-O)-methyltransferase
MVTQNKRKKKTKVWLQVHINDPYVKLAQREGYRTRAAYKLKEIDELFCLIQPGQHIVDLGSAPGAWSQYISKKLSKNTFDGKIIALDRLPMEPVKNVQFLQGDFREVETLEYLVQHINQQKLDLVLSDMAPDLSGVMVADAARMDDLIHLAIDFARQHLKPTGVLVAKLFQVSGYSQSVETFKTYFCKVKAMKPKSSRSHSKETFLVGIGLKY